MSDAKTTAELLPGCLPGSVATKWANEIAERETVAAALASTDGIALNPARWSEQLPPEEAARYRRQAAAAIAALDLLRRT